ncbi:hypothetical protein JOQ06_012623 [Pogonophryne albipinna]|uniref:G-protein coupled receptors family 1 profile domain-containing protein n=1 Tax=Pogonophryne albipinna TaxID=1090488 RepID=A0AAD6FSP1_9TELE|nr:hypothetical protein JOQ06_012623 [Pogonophryne albipinna]
MANISARHLSPDVYFYMLVGSADNLLGLPLNSWALRLIVSGKRSLVQSELLTLNLLVMENMCSMWFFFSFVAIFCRVHSLHLIVKFYQAMSVVGRALFQCHVTDLQREEMANISARHLSPDVYFYMLVGSADNLLGLPLNSWALRLIVSGKRSLVQSELLTLNLLVMENMCSMWFFFSFVAIFCRVHSLHLIVKFYQAMSVVGRALFQCHVCCGLMHVLLPEGTALYYIVALLFLVPFLLTELFCSVSIVRVLRRPGPGKKEKEGNRQKKRAVNIICMVLVMLVFNVVPFILMPFLNDVIQFDLTMTAFTLSTVGSSVQALLFLSRTGELPC